MNPEDKKKNILDLKHQRYTNYFNIIVILVISSFITVVIGTQQSWTLNRLVSTSLLILILIILLGGFYELLAKKIKEDINNI